MLVAATTPAPTPSPESTSAGEVLRDVGELTGSYCVSGSPGVCGTVYDLTGSRLAGRIADVLLGWPLRIVLILLVCFVARYLLMKVIDRTVAGVAAGRREARRGGLLESSPLLSERRQQRAQTLGSVLKSTTTLVIGVVAVLGVLGQLNINIAPFIASAGIVGVALGFGAQSLVRDFLSGVFMLAEDQYGVGDVVDLGDASGTVEAVGLRVTRLRDVSGTVWYVRNGEILRVGNQSQGWARAVLDVSVAYGADIAHVQEVLQRIGDRLAAEEAWKPLVLARPEVWGVEQMAADGVVLRMVVKTAPLQQWAVQRELRRRIKAAFDAEGIEFPFPQRTVWLRQDEAPATPPPARHGDPAAAGGSQPPRRSEADVVADDTGEIPRIR
ncbi:mechanosensitive ion channel family protein [Kineococcus terrestris]|uniref:mechanosensitive ion channel family protein n=1 Tax=Kineococcus terrestris TaxID=2044856 RepID=UPI0034DB34F6